MSSSLLLDVTMKRKEQTTEKCLKLEEIEQVDPKELNWDQPMLFNLFVND